MYKIADTIEKIFSFSYLKKEAYFDLKRFMCCVFTSYSIDERMIAQPNYPLALRPQGEELKNFLIEKGELELFEKFKAIVEKITNSKQTKAYFEPETVIEIDAATGLLLPPVSLSLPKNDETESVTCKIVAIACEFINAKLQELYNEGYIFPKIAEREVFSAEAQQNFIVK